MSELRDIPQDGGPVRRYLTILFSDLSASTNLVAESEAEDYADLMTELLAAYESVIPRHGGTIVQIQGDGVLACFGYPEAHDDDGRRATEAALALHERVASMRIALKSEPLVPLRLHTGIHSGLVLLIEGDQVRGRPGLFGMPVNVAARLSDLASPNEILVSEETLGPDRHFFQTGEGDIVQLQGIAEPIPIYRVVGRTPVGTRFEARIRRGLTSFVGRRHELKILKQGFSRAIQGEPQTYMIVAPPGLGKTRLAGEVLDGAGMSECTILRGYCESFLSAEPLQPFLQMIRALCGIGPTTPPKAALKKIDRTLSEIGPDMQAHRLALFRLLSAATASRGAKRNETSEATILAMQSLFGALAAMKPVVLFIDDWQWADGLTRQVLHGIQGLSRVPIFVLLAARDIAPDDIQLNGVRFVPIGRFSNSEADEIIRQQLPGEEGFFLAQIRDYSGGNPLFIEELCHSARQQDGKGRYRARHLSGEAWLNQLIEARVERLPKAQADLVRIAAIIGTIIPTWLLEGVTCYSSEDVLVRSLAEEDLIYPGDEEGTLRFKHGIVRDVIYSSVGLRERKAMHAKIAEIVRLQRADEKEEFCELLAYHYAASEQAYQAAEFAELAGDRALSASALDRAQMQYLAALNAIDEFDPTAANYQRRISIVQRLAFACVFDPSPEPVEALQRAAQLATEHDDRPAIAQLEYWLGYIRYAMGESGEAMRHLDAALACARDLRDDRLVRRIHATLGQASAAACDYDRSLALLDEAISQKRQRSASNKPAVGFAYTLACKGSVLGDRGEFAQAYDCFDEALSCVRGYGHEVEGSILCWLSGVRLWQGRWEEAKKSSLQAQSVAERVKSFYLFAMSRSLQSLATWRLDHSATALHTTADATSWLEARNKRLFISLNYGWLAEGMAELGQWERARQFAGRALKRSRSRDRLGEAMAFRAVARASAAGKAVGTPFDYIASALQSALARGSLPDVAITQLCEAEFRTLAGERAAAIAALDQAEAAFQRMAMNWHSDAAAELRHWIG
jgi:class 3 adenylate cyclase/tetratricopeptide (TPR) repeat protein